MQQFTIHILTPWGVGERYTISVAKALADAGYEVDLEWRDKDVKRRLSNRFGMDLSAINIKRDVKRGDGYDVCFWVSDGSIPMLLSRKNLLHFQIPFHDVNGRSLLNKMKLYRVNKIVVNSRFTKRFIDQEFGMDSYVLYPPVDTQSFKPGRKENLILFVGRFSQLKQAKHQDVLIENFKRLCDSSHKNWKLVLAGGADVGAGKYVEELTDMASDYPISIKKNPSFKEIVELYKKAKIFWSASGYGIEEEKEPERVEHFGISVVEAMSASAVPFVYNAGGHPEIVEDGETGYLWSRNEELLVRTEELMNKSKQLKFIGAKASRAAKKFSYERFEKELRSLIE